MRGSLCVFARLWLGGCQYHPFSIQSTHTLRDCSSMHTKCGHSKAHFKQNYSPNIDVIASVYLIWFIVTNSILRCATFILDAWTPTVCMGTIGLWRILPLSHNEYLQLLTTNNAVSSEIGIFALPPVSVAANRTVLCHGGFQATSTEFIDFAYESSCAPTLVEDAILALQVIHIWVLMNIRKTHS